MGTKWDTFWNPEKAAREERARRDAEQAKAKQDELEAAARRMREECAQGWRAQYDSAVALQTKCEAVAELRPDNLKRHLAKVARDLAPEIDPELVSAIVGDLVALGRLNHVPKVPEFFTIKLYSDENSDKFQQFQRAEQGLQYLQRLFFHDPDRTLSAYRKLVRDIFEPLSQLPPAGSQGFELPLWDYLPRTYPHDLVRRLLGTSWREVADDLVRSIQQSLEKQNIDCADFFYSPKPKDGHLSGKALYDAYFSDTPLERLSSIRVRLPLDRDARIAHTHVIGGSGAGKTTLLKSLIASDLRADDQPSLVILDPHRALLPEIARLKTGRRTLLISPEDPDHPPAINIFGVNVPGNRTEREKTERAVSNMLSDIFSLEKTALTGKQDNVFLYICMAMLRLPETIGRTATIIDVFRFLTDRRPYQAAIDQLDEFGRAFFEEFGHKESRTYRDTPAQLRARLYHILAQSHLRRLFASPVTKIDIKKEIDSGSVILIDTAQPHLGDRSAAIFGKIFVKMVLEAARQRWPIPERERKDTFFYIDEAESYLGEDVRMMLRDARKFRVGCVLAHQDFGLVSAPMRSGLAASTAVKFAGKLGAADAKAIAQDMRADAATLLGLPKHHFALHVDGMSRAIAIRTEKDPLYSFEKMGDAEYDDFVASNRGEVGYPAGTDDALPTFAHMSDDY